MASRSFALLGASGLVGGHLLQMLADDPRYSLGVLITRRALGLDRGKVREAIVDFDRPETFRPHLAKDDVFCCLGTTIKKAGSQAAFRRVDCDIPVSVAREACAAGAGRAATAKGAAAGADVYEGPPLFDLAK